MDFNLGEKIDMSTITEQLDEIILNISHEVGLIERGRTISADCFPEARTRLQALMLRERLDEVDHITVCELDGENGAWYEPDEGYQQSISSRRSDLTQQLTALEGNTQEGEMK